MKIKILTLIAAGLVFFSSCTKEEVDPILEIIVTTKASEKWDQVDLYASTVRFAIESDDSNGHGWGSLQQYFGTPLETSLEQDNSMEIYNAEHFDMENLLGLRLMMGNILLSNSDTEDAKVNQPWFTYIPLDQPISIENGKSYKVEFIIDFDESIYEEDGEYKLNDNYTVQVTEK